MNKGLYQNPGIYDLAFSYRDYLDDASYLLKWHERLNKLSTQPANVLELACGPGRVLMALCSYGASGVGLDINRDMCCFAAELARQSKASIGFTKGDMTAFRLEGEFNLILTMLNSISHITRKSSLRNHFACVRDHLAPGGVYFLEATRSHESEFSFESSWSASDNGNRIDVFWSAAGQFEHVRISGNFDGSAVKIEEEFPMRSWRTSELIAAADIAGLSLAGCFGDFSADPVAQGIPFIELEGEQCNLHQCFAFTR